VWVTRGDDGAIEFKSRSDNESVDGVSGGHAGFGEKCACAFSNLLR